MTDRRTEKKLRARWHRDMDRYYDFFRMSHIKSMSDRIRKRRVLGWQGQNRRRRHRMNASEQALDRFLARRGRKE
jgi:hypothetical protein